MDEEKKEGEMGSESGQMPEKEEMDKPEGQQM